MNNYYDFLNPNKKKNNPLQGYMNIQSSLKEQQALNQSRLNNLFASKYGINQNVNPDLGWAGQSATDPISSWDNTKETSGLLEYNKLMGDKFAIQNALDQYNLLKGSTDKGRIEANILKERAEKYIPNQLRMAGLGSSGASESTLAGIGNQYLRNLSQLDQQYRTQGGSILNDYLANMANRDVNLAYNLSQLQSNNSVDDDIFTDGPENKDQKDDKKKDKEQSKDDKKTPPTGKPITLDEWIKKGGSWRNYTGYDDMY